MVWTQMFSRTHNTVVNKVNIWQVLHKQEYWRCVLSAGHKAEGSVYYLNHIANKPPVLDHLLYTYYYYYYYWHNWVIDLETDSQIIQMTKRQELVTRKIPDRSETCFENIFLSVLLTLPRFCHPSVSLPCGLLLLPARHWHVAEGRTTLHW